MDVSTSLDEGNIGRTLCVEEVLHDDKVQLARLPRLRVLDLDRIYAYLRQYQLRFGEGENAQKPKILARRLGRSGAMRYVRSEGANARKASLSETPHPEVFTRGQSAIHTEHDGDVPAP